MNGVPNGHASNFIGGAIRWLIVSIVSLTEKRSQRSCLGCGGGHTPESWGTDGFEWPAENLAVQTEAQTDLAGNQRNCLYRSWFLSHWIGVAGGTRPQPIRTEIKPASQRP